MVMKELIRCDEETQKTFLKEVGDQQQESCDFSDRTASVLIFTSESTLHCPTIGSLYIVILRLSHWACGNTLV